MKKVIHVLHHSLSYVSSDYKKFIYDGWPGRVCKNILKESNRYKLECYFPEKSMKKTKIIKKDGITYKLFPSTALRCNYEISIPLINEIKKQAKKHDIILHIHGIHNWHTYALCKKFAKDIPVILQHHGEKPYLKSKIRQSVEKRAFKHVSQVFTITKKESTYMSKFVNKNKIKMQTMGVDFNKFKPANKDIAKKKLGLNKNKKVLLYVGFAYKITEFDLLGIFEQLRNDMELVLVGDNSDNDFNKRARELGAKVYGRLPNTKMPDFYNASDVYLFPISKKRDEWLTGIGIAVIEALACGVPVVSGTLQHFPEKQSNELGIVLEKDLKGNISYILKNYKKYKKCRDLAKKYYDWKVISKDTLKTYDRLLR